MSAQLDTKLDLKNRIFKNISIGFVARLYYLGTRFILTPITLAHVTMEEYGIWAACFILISYMGMSSIGIANVYIRFVADYSARNEQKKINSLVSTGLVVTTIVCAALISVLVLCLPWVVQFLKIPASLGHVASVLVLATASSFMLDISFGVFSNILTGLQRIAEVNVIWVITVTLEVLLTFILLQRGYGIYSLAWAFGIRYVVATVLSVIYCFRVLPGLSISLKHLDFSNLKLFFGYGSLFQVSGLLSTFLYSIEKVIAGIFVGVQATALFDIGEKLPVMGSQLASSMNGIFMPALSHMNALVWKEEVVKLYLKGARYMNMMSGVMLAFMAFFAGPLLAFWMGSAEKFQPAVMLLMIFCAPYQVHILTGPGSAFHRGVGHPGRELVYPVIQLLLVGIFVKIGFAFFGKTTLVIGLAVALAMFLSAVTYMAYSNRAIRVPQRRFWIDAFLPGVVPYIFASLVAVITAPLFSWSGTNRLRLGVSLGLSGLLYIVAIFPVLYLLFCSWGEREYLKRQASHTFGGLLRGPA